MEKDKNKQASGKIKKEADLDKYYRDQSGLSVKKMNFGLWLALNRRKMLKSIIIILALVCVALFAYSGYQYAVYLITGRATDNFLLQNTQVMSSKTLNNQLSIGSLQVFKDGDRYDAAVKVKNPNDKFMADLRYCLREESGEEICQDGFIFPAQEKYLLFLGAKLKDASRLDFYVKNISWQRLNAHDYPDWSVFYEARSKFSVSNLDFNGPESFGSLNNRLKFKIVNNTPFSFYEAPFIILIFNGDQLVGVNRYIAKNFNSGEFKEAELSWNGYLGSVSPVLVVPDIKITQSDIYIRPR